MNAWPQRQLDLLAWYDRAKRDLPWRRTNDPYDITVSEFMLQQTQVVTVIPYYERWLRQFPNWQSLAAAPSDTVLKAWEGLGYYTRARNLHAVAKRVVELGAFPQTHLELLALPGFGPYTAAAVGSIAFGLSHGVLDGNVMRVLTRLEAISAPIDEPTVRRKLQTLADQWIISGLPLSKERNVPGDHNQAVMELGATLCLPRKSQCLICPLSSSCQGRLDPESYPVKKRTEAVDRTETIALICDSEGRFACEQVPPKQAWAGLWRFPDLDPVKMELIQSTPAEEPFTLRYGITKYRVVLTVVRARWKKSDSAIGSAQLFAEESPTSYGHYSMKELDEKAMAAPHRKVLNRLQKLIGQ